MVLQPNPKKYDPMPYKFKLDNQLVIFHMYATTNAYHQPLMTYYILQCEGALNYEVIDHVKGKHYNQVYWETIYNCIFSLELPSNIIVCTPINVAIDKYYDETSRVKYSNNYSRRRAMWLDMEKQIKRMGHGFKYVHNDFKQLDLALKLHSYKAPILAEIREKYNLSIDKEKNREGEFSFEDINPSESHIEREYLFSFDLSQ